MARIRVEGKIENVTLADLKVDTAYQRGLKAHFKRIAAEFDPDAAGVLHVGRRGDGSMWIIDGQQRREAMMKLGIKVWKAIVIESHGQQYEANVFRLLNAPSSRKGLSPQDLFKACLVAKDPIAEAANRACEAAGVKIVLSSRRGVSTWPEFASVGMLYRMTARWGEDVVYRAFNLIIKTWPGQKDALWEHITGATILLMARQGTLIDDERFIEVMGKIHPREYFLTVSRDFPNQRQAGMVHVLARQYNKGIRTEKKKLKVYSADEYKGEGRRGHKPFDPDEVVA